MDAINLNDDGAKKVLATYFYTKCLESPTPENIQAAIKWLTNCAHLFEDWREKIATIIKKSEKDILWHAEYIDFKDDELMGLVYCATGDSSKALKHLLNDIIMNGNKKSFQHLHDRYDDFDSEDKKLVKEILRIVHDRNVCRFSERIFSLLNEKNGNKCIVCNKEDCVI